MRFCGLSLCGTLLISDCCVYDLPCTKSYGQVRVEVSSESVSVPLAVKEGLRQKCCSTTQRGI